MEDSKIIDLYWARDEGAIAQTRSKYGRYCYAIAYNILHSKEEAEENENDTYMDTWDSMPPQKKKPSHKRVTVLNVRITYLPVQSPAKYCRRRCA